MGNIIPGSAVWVVVVALIITAFVCIYFLDMQRKRKQKRFHIIHALKPFVCEASVWWIKSLTFP